ncbi:sugar phosphate isomerase/epimerase family protein [Algisphaera agarilytica]|uniref:Sugar phosphate isomerase/epimerase n=1 Tax=Algisphaera agarilytica TaxID=1385975 RepID=A0A7X0H9F3_9BACT|nr:TIM barrel protein [Algisphaera agarilytica]MBB6431708.1 sugar phosphate isomerase/epimerase [Algisphaera agarilytica]
MIYLTGFADEASDHIEGQVKAIQTLGWSHIELRAVNGTNITDISDDEFEHVARYLDANDIAVNAFGSTICNWGKSILEPMDKDLAEIERAIPRMKALGTKYIRIMSYAVLKDRDMSDQLVDERIDRVRRVVDRFGEEGLEALHENCANYGGMGWRYTLELVEKIPGLRLIFDTANPATTVDRKKPGETVTLSSWEFYENVRPHIAHVHIKDGRFLRDNPDSVFEDADYVWPGEGDGEVKRIVSDLFATGYDGGLSIEPHLSVVFHGEIQAASEQARFDSFVEYGKRLEQIVNDIRSTP